MSRAGRRATAVFAALGLFVVALAGCDSGSSANGRTDGDAAPTSTATATGAPSSAGPGVTLVATTHGDIPAFAGPGQPVVGTVPGKWQGAPSTLPVVRSQPGWYEVRLAQRPNGGRAWVLARDVTIASTPYRIVIDLASTRLTVLRNNRPVASVPVGIGTPKYPTPTGHFFVALLAQPPEPAYGSFVIVTSAHSDTITDWERSGDAIIGIHGPLGSDQAIGTRGAAVSHGCVRLHENDLLRLRPVPVGSPVDIV
jgi:lipoprotein-anchoring transpeptidase ErfK/SrfK